MTEPKSGFPNWREFICSRDIPSTAETQAEEHAANVFNTVYIFTLFAIFHTRINLKTVCSAQRRTYECWGDIHLFCTSINKHRDDVQLSVID